MSRGFVKEGDQEEIPVVTPRAFLPSNTPNYVTQEGLMALRREMEQLCAERDNTEAGYVSKNFANAKIAQLQQRINSAVVHDPSKATQNCIGFGAYVKYNNRIIRIVGVDEADTGKGLISFVSPIAQALIGHRENDNFEIAVPNGKLAINIQQISYTPLELTHETISSTEKSTKGVFNKHNAQAKPNSNLKATTITHDDNEETPPKSQNVNKGYTPDCDTMQFLPLVNERGLTIGRALHCQIHNGNKLLHPVIHLHVLNPENLVHGKYWRHIPFGMKHETFVEQMAEQLLDNKPDKPQLIKTYQLNSATENELVYVYRTYYIGVMPQHPDKKQYLLLFEKDGIQ